MENASESVESNTTSYQKILICLNQHLHNSPKMQSVETIRSLMHEQLNEQIHNPNYIEDRLREERAEEQTAEINQTSLETLIKQRQHMEKQVASLNQQLSVIANNLNQLTERHVNEKYALFDEQAPPILDKLQQALNNIPEPTLKEPIQTSMSKINSNSEKSLSLLRDAVLSAGVLSSSDISSLEQASDKLAQKQGDEILPLWKQFEALNKAKQDLIKVAVNKIEYREIPATSPEDTLDAATLENNRPQLT